MSGRVAKPLAPAEGPFAPYWHAMSAGRFELQRCRGCRHWIHFPDVRCPRCRSTDLAFEPANGDGVVDTYTVVHRVFVPGFADEAPYAVGWIRLDQQPGLRVFADFVGVPRDRIRIGLRVTACFVDREGPRLSFRERP